MHGGGALRRIPSTLPATKRVVERISQESRIAMPKFKIITLGCKVNQAESEAIAGRLAEAHWTPAGPDETADLCIVNTCAVTQRAGMQSRQAVRRAIQDHPSACVAATGCYAQTDPQALEKIKGIACLVDQKDKLRLPEILSACSGAEGSRGRGFQPRWHRGKVPLPPKLPDRQPHSFPPLWQTRLGRF